MPSQCLFVSCWVLSMAVWRFGRFEERWRPADAGGEDSPMIARGLTRLLFLLWLMPVPPASAHDIAVEQPVEMVVQPQGARLVVRLNVPATLLAEAKLPRLQDGQLDAPAIDGVLSIVAADIARNLEVRQEDAPLAAPTTTVRVGADRTSIDVELVYAIRRRRRGTFGQAERVSCGPAAGAHERALPAAVRTSAECQRVGHAGTRAVRSWRGRCASAVRRARSARAAQQRGSSAVPGLPADSVTKREIRRRARDDGGARTGDGDRNISPSATGDDRSIRLTALAMVAASAVVIAALQNIVRARVPWVAPMALAFGVLNGFAFGESSRGSPTPLAWLSSDRIALTVFTARGRSRRVLVRRGGVGDADRGSTGHGAPERVVSVLASVDHRAQRRAPRRGPRPPASRSPDRLAPNARSCG